MSVSYQYFWQVVTGCGRKPCELAGAKCLECSHIRDAHHYVPKQRIKFKLGRGTQEAADALTDVRNGVCLCRTHHELVEAGALRSPKPAHLDAFIEDHGVAPREPHPMMVRAA
jgi:hypothetical protein